MPEANVTKGRQLILLARNDANTEWQVIGGVKSLSYSLDNPVEDTTSSSTTGEYQESEWTGYSQATLNISGLADKRTNIEDSNGYPIVGSSRLVTLATTGNRCANVRVINIDTGGIIEGFFNITSFSKTGETPGLMNFESTLQSQSNVSILGDV